MLKVQVDMRRVFGKPGRYFTEVKHNGGSTLWRDEGFGIYFGTGTTEF